MGHQDRKIFMYKRGLPIHKNATRPWIAGMIPATDGTKGSYVLHF